MAFISTITLFWSENGDGVPANGTEMWYNGGRFVTQVPPGGLVFISETVPPQRSLIHQLRRFAEREAIALSGVDKKLSPSEIHRMIEECFNADIDAAMPKARSDSIKLVEATPAQWLQMIPEGLQKLRTAAKRIYTLHYLRKTMRAAAIHYGAFMNELCEKSFDELAPEYIFASIQRRTR